MTLQVQRRRGTCGRESAGDVIDLERCASIAVQIRSVTSVSLSSPEHLEVGACGNLNERTLPRSGTAARLARESAFVSPRRLLLAQTLEVSPSGECLRNGVREAEVLKSRGCAHVPSEAP